jgi:hypothetical protein
VVLSKGTRLPLPLSSLSWLQALGLQVKVKEDKRELFLLREHTVCRLGERLEAAQVKLLQALGKKEAVQSISLLARWDANGFHEYNPSLL